MDTGNILPAIMGCLYFADDLVEMKGRGINDPCVRPGGGNDLRRHQRSGIQHHGGRFDQPEATNGNQIGCAGAGANEMDGHHSAFCFPVPLKAEDGGGPDPAGNDRCSGLH